MIIVMIIIIACHEIRVIRATTVIILLGAHLKLNKIKKLGKASVKETQTTHSNCN